MSDTQHDYVAGHYGPRASAYVSSAVHSGGPDLDRIAAVLQATRPNRVLDLGCGGGHVSYTAAPFASEVVACDLTPGMLAEVARTAATRGLANIHIEQAAAERLPFPDASFDAVLCRFSLHHWHDPHAGLREARRVIKPDGFAILIDTVAPAHPLLDTHLQAVELLRDPSHVRNMTAAELVSGLAAAGWATTALTPRRMRMDFDGWTARTRTPAVCRAALLHLQAEASVPVRDYFAIGPDGSFDLDAILVEVRPAPL
ncbi:class I SAM-dependent methyltransferase [Lichenihabitans sp. Uapishka_5]|uniref:class I SAM-dependent methyltransferase n=1 Tax=Lichenihabitans sp. Uapishka_5 TaxID=3037302 RepID=UPI0029E80DBD|nr:class I SAM-dependent methyltransferase [Lichenihabitans sp. Uapishka_5]MDX7952639.1 class I SAM-dependent methyltransferase [Lichenihabitans sp. Uapishka_5]